MLFFKNISLNSRRLSCAVAVAALFESARGGSVDDYGCDISFNENSECSNFLVGFYAANVSFFALTGLMVLLDECRNDSPSLPYVSLVLSGFAISFVISLGLAVHEYSNCNYEDPACIPHPA